MVYFCSWVLLEHLEHRCIWWGKKSCMLFLILFIFPSLQLREAMAAMRKSAQDVQKFMDAVNKKTNAQDALKGQCVRASWSWQVLADTCMCPTLGPVWILGLFVFFPKKKSTISFFSVSPMERPIRIYWLQISVLFLYALSKTKYKW